MLTDRELVAKVPGCGVRILPGEAAVVPFSAPTLVPVDAEGDSVLICDYTGKEVVE
jgi:hypothetical protein